MISVRYADLNRKPRLLVCKHDYCLTLSIDEARDLLSILSHELQSCDEETNKEQKT